MRKLREREEDIVICYYFIAVSKVQAGSSLTWDLAQPFRYKFVYKPAGTLDTVLLLTKYPNTGDNITTQRGEDPKIKPVIKGVAPFFSACI